jgi:hypothetical protein
MSWEMEEGEVPRPIGPQKPERHPAAPDRSWVRPVRSWINALTSRPASHIAVIMEVERRPIVGTKTRVAVTETGPRSSDWLFNR